MNGSPVLFRSYHQPQSLESEIPLDCRVWEAARATSAAPTFFKRIIIGNGQPYIDAAIGCNNPSDMVLNEAKALFGAREIGCFLSIGTGQTKVTSIREPGFLQRLVPTDVIRALKAAAIDCQTVHRLMLNRFKRSPNVYFRLDVDKGMAETKLYEWKKMVEVEAHTMSYMRGAEVGELLSSLTKAIMRDAKGKHKA